MSMDTLTPLDGSSAPRAPRGRILVVDDDPVARSVTSAQLRKLGFLASAAPDGRAALDELGRGRYDAMILDCEMPVLDGYATIAAVRAAESSGGPRLPVVGLTGGMRPDQRDRCLAAGMDDYVAKPAGLEHIAGALARWFATGGSESTTAEAGLVDFAAIERLREQFGAAAPDIVGELVRCYLGDAPNQIAALETARAAMDGNLLRESAHRLRGSSCLLGAHVLAECCETVENAARDGDVAAAAAAAGGLSRIFDGTADVLRRSFLG